MRRLDQEPELHDLHTHLLGMGNTGFWINTVLENYTILPTNNQFYREKMLRTQLCPLVWDHKNSGFLNGEQIDVIIQYLIDMNYPDGKLEELDDLIQRELPNTDTVFNSMVTEKNAFLQELQNHGLKFQEDFSYDVVLKLDDLAKGFGADNRSQDFIQAAVEEKLGFPMISLSNRPQFRHWIIFNARKQCFEVVYGITVEQLRNLIEIDANAPRESKQARTSSHRKCFFYV